MSGGGVALARCRRVLEAVDSPTLDHDSGVKTVSQALDESPRRVVANAAGEPSIVIAQVEPSQQAAFGYSTAMRELSDLLQTGVIDPAKVTRMARQNAASIAGLPLTTDCVLASELRSAGTGAAGMLATEGLA